MIFYQSKKNISGVDARLAENKPLCESEQANVCFGQPEKYLFAFRGHVSMSKDANVPMMMRRTLKV